MRKRFVKTKKNTNDHRRKRLTRNQLRLVLSATTLSAILAGCGVSDNVTTEEVESDLTPITTEAVTEAEVEVTTTTEVNNKVSEYSYLYDRLADTYGEFVVDVKEDGKAYSITVKMDSEEIFGYELTYDEATHIFTCEDNIILDNVELVEGNVEYITLTDEDVVVENSGLDYEQEDMNVGKRVMVEEIKESELKEAGYDVELEGKDKAYKVTYLDLEGTAEDTTEENTTETPVASNPSPTVKPDNNPTPKPPATTNPTTTTPTTEAPSNNGGSTTPTTETPAVPSVPSTPSTTETPSVPTTEEVKECQHNWVEVMTTKEEYSHTDHICLNCGFTSTNLDECINHCSGSGCAGYYTHEELISAGWKETDPVYQARIGKAKGTSYTSKERYNTIEVGTGKYYCDKCYHTKQN